MHKIHQLIKLDKAFTFQLISEYHFDFFSIFSLKPASVPSVSLNAYLIYRKFQKRLKRQVNKYLKNNIFITKLFAVFDDFDIKRVHESWMKKP